eukprot:GHVT01095662.1.p1 GENE.GHVT01095662.1~~GHVT01095662.1.p1  ORF type:complete len:188 (-),score=9.31 GHVT01095662.1:127-690(-)
MISSASFLPPKKTTLTNYYKTPKPTLNQYQTPPKPKSQTLELEALLNKLGLNENKTNQKLKFPGLNQKADVTPYGRRRTPEQHPKANLRQQPRNQLYEQKNISPHHQQQPPSNVRSLVTKRSQYLNRDNHRNNNNLHAVSQIPRTDSSQYPSRYNQRKYNKPASTSQDYRTDAFHKYKNMIERHRQG